MEHVVVTWEMVQTERWLDSGTGCWLAATRCEMCGWECRASDFDPDEAVNRSIRHHRHDHRCPVAKLTMTKAQQFRAEVRHVKAVWWDSFGGIVGEIDRWLAVAPPWRAVYAAGAMLTGALIVGALIGDILASLR